jgi:hypothetical protein
MQLYRLKIPLPEGGLVSIHRKSPAAARCLVNNLYVRNYSTKVNQKEESNNNLPIY